MVDRPQYGPKLPPKKPKRETEFKFPGVVGVEHYSEQFSEADQQIAEQIADIYSLETHT